MTEDAPGALLKGKVGFITGAARGIGLAVARAFTDHGASVVIADIATDEARQSASSLGDDQAMAVSLDVTDEASTERAVESAMKRFGRIDCVVANAGILMLKHAVQFDTDDWRRVVDVNLTGAFITTKVVAKQMIEQDEGGRIILTSSLFGLRGGVENAAYSASKFGMIGLAQSLAAELAPHDILVNSVCPGQMDTDMIRQLFRDRAQLRGTTEEEVRGALEGRIPLGHLGPLDHLAGTYVYLASDLSRYVTGQAIVVDGGWQIG
ncbi:MAG: SDR family oxidoreductase [Alphaproteobacteria bacterium]|nr:SDR family oxidoreductase [Alphaproteobacteria bacterium]